MAKAELSILLALIDQAFDHHAWHGTNLRGSIRGLSAAKATWRPAPNRHNIWETVVHAAYWKYIVRRRILSETKGSFPLKGSNWFKRPADGEITDAAWKADVALLIETHKSLRAAVEQLSPKAIDVTPEGSTVSNLAIIMGIASHDLYHAGQIQLLKRLQPK
jgi:uncharacterized damage-inducible protein DinB